MSNQPLFPTCCLCLFAICLSAGCGEPGAVVETPSAYRLDAAPAGPAVSISEAAERLSDSAEPQSITLVGRIGPEASVAFDPQSSMFLINELPPPGHDDPGHADNCPFCKRRAASAPHAMVRLIDADGVILVGPADRAAGLNPGDVIEVTGPASYDPALSTVTIDAPAVYVRPH